MVTSISAGAARKTGTTLKWLRASGYQRLGESAVLAINRIEGVKPNTLAATELKRLASQFPPQRVVVLPFDRHVHEGRAISLERLSNQSRRRYLEMAAALASAFPSAIELAFLFHGWHPTRDARTIAAWLGGRRQVWGASRPGSMLRGWNATTAPVAIGMMRGMSDTPKPSVPSTSAAAPPSVGSSPSEPDRLYQTAAQVAIGAGSLCQWRPSSLSCSRSGVWSPRGPHHGFRPAATGETRIDRRHLSPWPGAGQRDVTWWRPS
ncbi:hypothetical protein I553_7126 [Mycobacterium xenopi 4042]|uniref:Uncharacterized protein n=1 Tax=Mycobacterium xenopi 4042 TaxID=1299334 RepID=X7Z4N1_MYCXE|nr:hypothetical protein I553_7126 [Mycobacterium xenopi 4042]